MRTDRDIKMISCGIGFSLAVMAGFIALIILSLFFGDIKRLDSLYFGKKYGSFVFILWVILTATPILLMLKAYFSEYLKNYQHPFFRNKSENVKMVIFFALFSMFILTWYAR